ncbi:UNC-97-like protein [Aphelenchoides fujianensis]|nr:UNC-97-like protein [Aphelenchoides fujianensis]
MVQMDVNGYVDGPHTADLDGLVCVRCNDIFKENEQVVNSGNSVWHAECFVCSQCFLPFEDGIYYEFDGRKYCEHDFHVLYAPCCGKCNEFIVGRVIKAMNANWHPACFTCERCDKQLADVGFLRNAGRALCRECNEIEKAAGSDRYVCHKCNTLIDGGHIKFKGDTFHPYHFNCKRCGTELTEDAREIGGELFCLRCHDTMGIPICGACHRPIEERVITALGKNWHIEHFVCAVCEKPFMGHKHYERKGLAYCEQHFHLLYGRLCFRCSKPCGGEVFQALGKSWCVNCFACTLCDKKLDQKTRFYEFDMKPTCKNCYGRFPTELKKRISDNLKEREVETLRRRSASPAPRKSAS